MGEHKRHQMMQNLFGDQSEEEEEEIDSEHESNPQPGYISVADWEGMGEGFVCNQPKFEVASPSWSEVLKRSGINWGGRIVLGSWNGNVVDEGEGGPEPEGEGEIEGQGEAEVESEGELRDVDPDPGESEAERDQSSEDVEVGDQREESEGRETGSDEKEGYGQRVVTSRRRDVIESGSERSEENHYADHEDEEVDQARIDHLERRRIRLHNSHSVAEIRDVFGESDDEEAAEYAVDNDIEQNSIVNKIATFLPQRSPMEEEGSYEKNLRPEDILPDEDAQYGSEEENVEIKSKEKPVGPPLVLEVPLRRPPAHPDKYFVTDEHDKVSNIMGIEPKPFDPKTYVEEDTFVTDESGSKKRIRLENNIVRWRNVKNPDGTTSYESNARFVRWSDGSLQLLIGNEVLDISVQDAQHDQSHLFLRHGKDLLCHQNTLYACETRIPSFVAILITVQKHLPFRILDPSGMVLPKLLVTFMENLSLMSFMPIMQGILQSQGRILRKMRFMPSSLSSNSHRLLTALVDSRHKKVYKVKNCITDIDPEREKEEKEKAVSQTIRANQLLNRKREKVNRKYTQTVDRGRQLSPGFLEEALDEVCAFHLLSL
ncbi:Protein LEO1-like [Vitis vinifera]|uniref:Protein LEO1-like n=1 Tax=Vitis vinifera TaxID=29760 RepID=A0A438FER1_VITVI|nr:Protein LEO1-like [Vitis vinifera]